MNKIAPYHELIEVKFRLMSHAEAIGIQRLHELASDTQYIHYSNASWNSWTTIHHQERNRLVWRFLIMYPTNATSADSIDQTTWLLFDHLLFESIRPMLNVGDTFRFTPLPALIAFPNGNPTVVLRPHGWELGTYYSVNELIQELKNESNSLQKLTRTQRSD